MGLWPWFPSRRTPRTPGSVIKDLTRVDARLPLTCRCRKEGVAAKKRKNHKKKKRDVPRNFFCVFCALLRLFRLSGLAPKPLVQRHGHCSDYLHSPGEVRVLRIEQVDTFVWDDSARQLDSNGASFADPTSTEPSGTSMYGTGFRCLTPIRRQTRRIRILDGRSRELCLDSDKSFFWPRDRQMHSDLEYRKGQRFGAVDHLDADRIPPPRIQGRPDTIHCRLLPPGASDAPACNSLRARHRRAR